MLGEIVLIVVGTVHSLAGLPLTTEDIDVIIEQDMCVEYVDEAIQTGWESHEIPQLLRIMHRESRCLPDACGVTDRPDLRKCRDWGLMQINDYSWKTTVRSMDLDMEQMHDPFWNLFFARHIFEMAEHRYGCGWQPWSVDC